jgi:hypothetical protein
MPAIKTSLREIGQIIGSKGQLAAIRPKAIQSAVVQIR